MLGLRCGSRARDPPRGTRGLRSLSMAQTHVPCTAKQTLNLRTARGVPWCDTHRLKAEGGSGGLPTVSGCVSSDKPLALADLAAWLLHKPTWQRAAGQRRGWEGPVYGASTPRAQTPGLAQQGSQPTEFQPWAGACGCG